MLSSAIAIFALYIGLLAYDSYYVKPLQVEQINSKHKLQIEELENAKAKMKNEIHDLKRINVELESKIRKWQSLCPNL